MKFTIYNDPNLFLKDVIAILNIHAIQNNLLLKNATNGIIGENKLMATVKDDNNNVILTVVQTKPFPLTMYETNNVYNEAAIRFLIENFIKENISINSVMSEKKLSKFFADFYSSSVSKQTNLIESLVLYTIDKSMLTSDFPLEDKVFRLLNKSDLYYIPYWLNDFNISCKLDTYNLENISKQIKTNIEKTTQYILEDNNIPVSTAAITRIVDDCAFISYVYTPPHYRTRGYSTLCVGNLVKLILSDKYTSSALYADCNNPYSNKVYQNIGFKIVFFYDKYEFID